MAAFLSVGRGSSEASVFLEMNYFGAEKRHLAPLILVGKGEKSCRGCFFLKYLQRLLGFVVH